MILDEVVLENFGVFEGRQVVHLSPPYPKKPIVLFGGMNGGGKTTFLDAINLTLFGKHAKCSNRSNHRYDDYLRRCIHRHGSQPKGSALEVSFRTRIGGVEHAYKVSRLWEIKGKGVKEQLEVMRNGELDPVLTEAWEEHVDEFMPTGIAHLFFFDGEKIENLADPDKSQELFATAFSSLLGIDLLDRLQIDLQALERRKAKEDLKGLNKEKTEKLEAEVQRSDRVLEEMAIQRASAQNDQDAAHKSLRKIDSQYQKEGGQLFEQREKLEAEQKATAEALKRCEEQMRLENKDGNNNE